MYRIANWDESFENNRTRELKTLSWVPFPNKHDGDGYTELLDHKEGTSHYGAWCVLVQVASKCDPRGTLVRDSGKPHDSTTLARMTRFPPRVLKDAIDRLIDIGWIVVVSNGHDETCTQSHDGAGISQDGAALGPQEGALNGREWKEGNGKKEGNTASQVDAVVAHYKTYHAKAKPGQKELDKIRDRLKDGWSVDELKTAIDGCHRSPHHCGQNKERTKYQSLELIFRDAKHVQMFVEIIEHPSTGKSSQDLIAECKL